MLKFKKDLKFRKWINTYNKKQKSKLLKKNLKITKIQILKILTFSKYFIFEKKPKNSTNLVIIVYNIVDEIWW